MKIRPRPPLLRGAEPRAPPSPASSAPRPRAVGWRSSPAPPPACAPPRLADVAAPERREDSNETIRPCFLLTSSLELFSPLTVYASHDNMIQEISHYLTITTALDNFLVFQFPVFSHFSSFVLSFT